MTRLETKMVNALYGVPQVFCRLSDWEQKFVLDLRNIYCDTRHLSGTQREVLEQLYEKNFGAVILHSALIEQEKEDAKQQNFDLLAGMIEDVFYQLEKMERKLRRK